MEWEETIWFISDSFIGLLDADVNVFVHMSSSKIEVETSVHDLHRVLDAVGTPHYFVPGDNHYITLVWGNAAE